MYVLVNSHQLKPFFQLVSGKIPNELVTALFLQMTTPNWADESQIPGNTSLVGDFFVPDIF